MKLSVIIPVYNSEKYIKRCLDSLEQQTISNELEVIIINDGSTDKSGKIIEKYKNRFKSFKYEVIENNGVSNARNVGMSLASSEYITFLDSDDYVSPNFYESLLKDANKYDLIVAGYIIEYDSGEKISRKFSEAEYNGIIDSNKCFLYGKNIDPNVTHKIFKKSKIRDLEFDSNLAIAEDKLFLFYYIQNIKKIKCISECGYYYYMNNDSACRCSFNPKKFDSLIVAEIIRKYIYENINELSDFAKCMEIDVKCRVCGELSISKEKKKYKEIYNELKKDIRKFSISTKKKYTTNKHMIAFILAKLNPQIYQYVKDKLKFQYR